VNSWPAPAVDWPRLMPQLGHGDLVCVVHGRVDATRGPWELPICPRCEQLLSQAQRDHRTGALIGFAEPHPEYCAGPQRHPSNRQDAAAAKPLRPGLPAGPGA
jgi:hypothetical protein